MVWCVVFFFFFFLCCCFVFFFFFQAEDGIRDHCVTGVQTCALPICLFLVAAAPLLFNLPISRCGNAPLFILPISRCGSALAFLNAHLSLRQRLAFYTAHFSSGSAPASFIDRFLLRQRPRSEEHTSELQSHSDLVCRLLLEKKKKKK